MKTFFLYIYDIELQDYRSFRLKFSYSKLKEILQKNLSPKQWRYFLTNHQCYCNQMLGYKIQSTTNKAFIKQVSPNNPPLFKCTFCFQTYHGIYFFDFLIFKNQFKGRLKQILKEIRHAPYIFLNNEEQEELLKAITPKRLTARSINPRSIQSLLAHSFNAFVCLKHRFRDIPHIRKIINKNFCFEDPFFCYWFLYINNQDGNDTKACNLLLDKNISSFCHQKHLTEDSYYILKHNEILDLASQEVFKIGNGEIEVTLSTYDY